MSALSPWQWIPNPWVWGPVVRFLGKSVVQPELRNTGCLYKDINVGTSQVASLVVKNLPANAGDTGSIPGLGSSAGGESGNPVQYSCQDNTMDRGV